jgi:hypothetical protein
MNAINKNMSKVINDSNTDGFDGQKTNQNIDESNNKTKNGSNSSSVDLDDIVRISYFIN